MYIYVHSLRWRHNGHDSVSNHQPHGCLLNRLFRRRSKKTSKLRVTGLCAGNSPETGEFPAQMASNAENVSIWWRHHVYVGMWASVCVLKCHVCILVALYVIYIIFIGENRMIYEATRSILLVARQIICIWSMKFLTYMYMLQFEVHNVIWKKNRSTSQDLCTCFCILLWFVIGEFYRFILFHCHHGNDTYIIAPLPVNQPRWICVDT